MLAVVGHGANMLPCIDKLNMQVCSLSEQVAHLLLSIKQPWQSHLAADHGHGIPAAAIPAPGAKPWGHELAVDEQVGWFRICSFESVQEAGDKWLTGLYGFPAPPLLGEQATQCGHWQPEHTTTLAFADTCAYSRSAIMRCTI